MARRLHLAAAQLGGAHLADSRERMVERMRELLRQAHARGVRFVVFPELALCTFFPRYWYDDQAEVDGRFFESQMPSPVTAPLFDDARRFGIGLYLGYAELVQEAGRTRRFNTAVLVSPQGEIVGKYRKVHLPGHAEHKPAAAFQHLEKKYFEVGDLGFRTWKLPALHDAIVGMLICNDRRWPEAFRALTLQGAELVTLGFNTPSENLHYPEPPALRVHHHLIMAQAMAFMNATWLVQTAKCGFEDGHRMFGQSLIVAPSGEIVARSVGEDDELVSFDADLDLAQDLKRTMFDYAAHRRPEHYRILVDRIGAEVTPQNP